VWKNTYYQTGGSPRFFRISLRNESLKTYFMTNFALMQHHGYSLTELENMLPWERATYVSLVAQHVKEENDKIRERQLQRKSK
jgi:hypothetical protein